MLATRRPHLARWQAEQQARQEISKYQFRAPSFYLYKDDPAHRANVTVYLTLKNQLPETTNVVITHHRTERRYNHISFSSLKRLSAIAPLPLLSDSTFAAIEADRVAQDMLNAATAQGNRKPGRDAEPVKGVPALPPLGTSVDVQADADVALLNFELARQAAMESGTARVAFISK